jgi:hypothetical protein
MRPHISTGHSLRKRFVDTFQRTNTASDPGTSTDGSKWNVVSGIFNIVNNKLTTSTNAASYPMSVVDMNVQDVSIDISAPGQGTMAALWVTDSGNWWGVQTFSQDEACNCLTTGYACNGVAQYTDCNGVNHYADCNCGARSSQYCRTVYSPCNCTSSSVQCNCTYTAGTYVPGGCGAYVGSYCVAPYNSYTTAASYSCSTCTYYSCSACPSWGCDTYNYYGCDTCYSYTSYSQCYSYTSYSTCYSTSCATCYPQYVRVLNSAAGTVTALLSQAVAAVVASFRVLTKGNNITIKAYSDGGMTSQIGSDIIYTASSPVKTTKFGLSVTPSTYGQGSEIAKITIDRN